LTKTNTGFVGRLPVAVMNGNFGNGQLIPIDPNKLVTLFYKKDDFKLWAQPLLQPLLKHFRLYDKLMDADSAALDGVISHIRLWRLGSLEHRIFPTPAAVERLAEVLANNLAGGSMDLIWGPELELQETGTEIAKFLGTEKYEATLQAIFQGLGVPMSLTGMGDSANLTNNFMGLKVLIDRLEYGRMLITKFWMDELDIIRNVMGFREPFEITYDQASLSDEASMVKLLIDMADRDILSYEFVQKRIGAIPSIEANRLQRETKARKKGKLPPKAGPFHLDSQQQATLERTFVNQGGVTPGQMGIDMKDRKPGEKTLLEHQSEQEDKKLAQKKATQLSKTKKAQKNGTGRPVGSKDSNPRKKKIVKVKTKAEQIAIAMAWASEAQGLIEETIRPAFLAAHKKKNLRQITDAESQKYEAFKFATLCQFDVGEKITKTAIKRVYNQGTVSVPKGVEELYQVTLARHIEKEGTKPTADKVRQIQAAVYALYKAQLEKEDEDGEDYC